MLPFLLSFLSFCLLAFPEGSVSEKLPRAPAPVVNLLVVMGLVVAGILSVRGSGGGSVLLSVLACVCRSRHCLFANDATMSFHGTPVVKIELDVSLVVLFACHPLVPVPPFSWGRSRLVSQRSGKTLVYPTESWYCVSSSVVRILRPVRKPSPPPLSPPVLTPPPGQQAELNSSLGRHGNTSTSAAGCKPAPPPRNTA